MNSLTPVVGPGFVHYFEDFRQRVHSLSAKLSDDQYWAKPHPYGNSFGNLVLHLTGNLNYYIGAQIEETGYCRNRESEFEPVKRGNRLESLAEFDQSVTMVIQSLLKQREEDWSRNYNAVGVDDVHDRFSIYLRCCVHFHHHIGQMIYLVKAWEESSHKLN